jgi:hypothetical protein
LSKIKQKKVAPLPDIFELVRVVDQNLNAELHPRLLKVDIQAGNFGIGYPFWHGFAVSMCDQQKDLPKKTG